MQQLTPEGEQLVADLSSRYGFSREAVTQMLIAVLNGNGSMAQFSHPEFGGSGQWMKGGMMMIGDMFNNVLKNNVDGLCNEISNILANQPGLLRTGSFQLQSQSGSGEQAQSIGGATGQSNLFVPNPDDNWWPSGLGVPNSTGSQNNVRYAYFPNAHRLAVKTGREIWVYDTLDHQIGGFSQQQGTGSSISFSSQYGTIDLTTLPVVMRNGEAVQTQQPNGHSATSTATSSTIPTGNHDILAAISTLGDLRDKGYLTDNEFNVKKAELLSRL